PGISVRIERHALERYAQTVQKLLLQRSVDERVFRNTAGVRAGQATAIGDPGDTVGSKGNVERTASVILLNPHGVIRIAAEEHVHTVIAKTGDPDVAGRVRRHPLCPERAALVPIGSRDRCARSRELRHASISPPRWHAARALSPAKVALPHGALGIDGDP